MFVARGQHHRTGLGAHWPTEAHVRLVQDHRRDQEPDANGARVLREQEHHARQDALRNGRQEKRRHGRGTL